MRWLKRALLIFIGLFAAAQFFRPVRANPPVDDSKTLFATEHVPPEVRSIFERSCSDCHTNETRWPWYSSVSPLSWWLVDHVTEAREELNLSEWGSYSPKRQQKKLEQICEEVGEGEMPLKSYLPLHPRAKLTDTDRETLCRWTKSL